MHRILPYLPVHDIYLEPCVGGGSVFFAKRPARLETINDVDQAIVEFYRVVRDPEQFAQFVRLVETTPYARAEYETCRRAWRDATDPVQRAWAWFVVARQAFGGAGRGETGWKVDPRRPSTKTNSWGRSTAYPDSSAGSRWLSAVAGLPAVHARLRGAQIECGDWRCLLETFSGPGVLAYIDPPYVLTTRVGGARYAYEMSMDDHRSLTECLLSWQGMAVLSGYRLDVIHGPLEAAGWERINLDVALNVCGGTAHQRRTESLWSNPAAVAARRQPRLFAVAQGSGGG